MKFKGNPIEDRLDEFDRKEAGLNSKWEDRLKDQIIDLPDFGQVFKLVKKKYLKNIARKVNLA